MKKTWDISEYQQSFLKYKEFYPFSLLNDEYFTSFGPEYPKYHDEDDSDKLPEKPIKIKYFYSKEHSTCFCGEVSYVELDTFEENVSSLSVRSFFEDEGLLFFGKKTKKINKSQVKKGDTVFLIRSKILNYNEDIPVVEEETKIIPFYLSSLLKFEKLKNESITNPVSECFVCKKQTENLLKCGNCLAVKYCSQPCQKTDWINHKYFCQISPIYNEIMKSVFGEVFQNFKCMK